MKKGEVYVPFVDLPSREDGASSTDDFAIKGGRPYVIDDPASGRIVDRGTGEVLHLLPLQARRPEWYMQKTFEADHMRVFNPKPRIVPTLAELVREGVWASAGLPGTNPRGIDRVALHELLHEACPRKRFTVDTLSGILADDPRIEMVDPDGNVVSKLDHNARFCTFRPKGWVRT